MEKNIRNGVAAISVPHETQQTLCVNAEQARFTPSLDQIARGLIGQDLSVFDKGFMSGAEIVGASVTKTD